MIKIKFIEDLLRIIIFLSTKVFYSSTDSEENKEDVIPSVSRHIELKSAQNAIQSDLKRNSGSGNIVPSCINI